MDHEKKKERVKRPRKATAPLERRYQRATCDFPAEFSWGTITHPARVKVISIGGCFLETAVMVPPHAEMDVQLWMDAGSRPLHCLAKVVWVAERGIKIKGPKLHPGFALEFQKMYPEDRALLDEYVRRQLRIFRAIGHELEKAHLDRALIKDLFQRVCPHDSTNLAHVRKVCAEELRFFRLRP